MMLQTESGIWADADARVFAILMAPNRTERRRLAAERTISAAISRVAALTLRQAAAEAREHMRASRALEREERDLERSWGKAIRIKMPPAKKRVGRKRRNAELAAATILKRRPRAYREPLKDRRGRIAVVFITKYLGLKTKGWRAGLAAEHIFYILRDEALEETSDPELPPISNIASSVEEIATFWTALETIEQGYRANAKIQHRIIWNLPHQLGPEQRRHLVEDFCERTFGRLGLPYVAAIHEPDPDGDQRNFHVHICWSTRPFERVGANEWELAAEKVNGLDDKAGLRRLRALAAAHMNLACLGAGVPARFTHQTYAERGLDARRQEHVGPAAMAAYRNGNEVGAIARNEAIVEQNEAAVEAQRVAEAHHAHARLAGLLRRRDTLAAISPRVAGMQGRVREIAATARRALSSSMERGAGSMADRAGASQKAAARISASLAHSVRARTSLNPVIRGRRLAEQIVSSLAARPRPNLKRDLIRSIDLRRSAEPLGSASRRTSRTRPAAADMLHASAASIATKTNATNVSSRTIKAKQIARSGPQLADVIARLQAAHGSAANGQRRLDKVDTALHEQRRGERLDREAAVRALIMGLPTPPYRYEGHKFIAVLSGLKPQELELVRSVDLDVCKAAILERRARDQEQADIARRHATERAAADARAVADARNALIREACRIVREARHRPYRLENGRATPDWSGLEPHERETVKAVGLSEEQLRAALIERAKSDHAADSTMERLFHALETERHYLPPRNGGRAVDDHLLERFGVEKARLVEPQVQERLHKIAERQSKEILRIKAYLTTNAGQVVREQDSWSVRATAPTEIRALVEAWRADPVFQNVLARTAASKATASDAVPRQPAIGRLPDEPGRAGASSRGVTSPRQLAVEADEKAQSATTPGEPDSTAKRPGPSSIPPWLRGEGPAIGS